MQIHLEPFDLEQQHKDIVEALAEGNESAIYLDTSVLVWLYRIRQAAREELLQLLGSPALKERAHIPLWSLHELSRHRKSENVLFPLRSHQAKLRALLKDIKADALLFVDEKFASGTQWRNEDVYIDALEKACDELEKVSTPLGQVGNVTAVDRHLASFLSDRALNLPFPNLAQLRDEFVARCEGRLPPGYEDGSKKGHDPEDGNFAGANRFGDFVLWRTVLDHARQHNDIKTVVILTHDMKRDWVGFPAQIKGYGEKNKNEQKGPSRVSYPQPILCCEIKAESGVERLFIITVNRLVSALNRHGRPSDVSELARSIQRDTEVEETAKAEAAPVPEASPAPGPVVTGLVVAQIAEIVADTAGEIGELVEEILELSAEEKRRRLQALPEHALADAKYTSELAGSEEADEIIKALKSYRWPTQNLCVRRVPSVLELGGANDADLFIIGRNIYQAACGNAYRAMDFLKDLGSRPEPNAFLLFAGAVYEAYVDSQDKNRESLKDAFLAILFKLAKVPAFAPVASWFRDKRDPAKLRFLWLPGDVDGSVIFDVAFSDSDIATGITWDGRDIAISGESRDFDMSYMRDVAYELANHLHLPFELIEFEPEWEDERDFSHITLCDPTF